MKKKFFLFFLATLIFTSCKNNSVQISGTLENTVKGEYIFLAEIKSNELKTVDSVRISENGSFKFEKNVKIPMLFVLKINSSNFLTMLVEPGEKIKLTAHHDSLNYPGSISGSRGTELMVGYNETLKNTINKLMGLNDIYSRNVGSPNLTSVIESLDSLAQIYLNEINSYTKKYIDDNLSSLVSLVALYQQVAPNVYVLNPSKDLKYFEKVDSTLFSLYPESDPVISLHTQVQELVSRIKGEKDLASISGIGDKVPEISLPSPKGDTIKLSATRGKIVLLDFWASWCPPCRQENPNLVDAYNLYHNKGFEIFQVSLDKTKEEWIKGIQADKLERWIHVSDVKYWNSVVVPMFKIESIPFNLLLDKEGRVLVINLRGSALQTKLDELFN
jgi:thiol-disulfide isomerase/thioredoxin